MTAGTPVSTPLIINCHTHVFTVQDVPPLLAKGIAPWPLYFLLRTRWIAGPFKWFTNRWYDIKRKRWFQQMTQDLYLLRMAMKRYFILRLIKMILGVWILLSIFHDQYPDVIKPWLASQGITLSILDRLYSWLAMVPFLLRPDGWLGKTFWLFVFLLLFPVGRNILWALLRQFNRFVKLLPGKQTVELAKRYSNIIRYANYQDQNDVYTRLKNQYPPRSKMVVLPMDMEYMGAGKPQRAYDQQMEMLASIKNNHPDEFYPFVFVDPRRTTAGGKTFFDYEAVDGNVVLKDCFIRDYIEDKHFNGFKIYPALGYFPFDERLLALWKYAADNGIPIMTHCIRGVIYYRNRKEKDWDFHPVFQKYTGAKNDPRPQAIDFTKMLLPQMKPVDVQEIFTHPLNYACLYKRRLLKKLVREAEDSRLRDLFGYDHNTDTIQRGLSHLKLCFGHFGGEDEWKKFFEKDRSNYGHNLIQFPDKGIDFFRNGGAERWGKLADVWDSADWYSIICSLMLQHPHVYADISYILHGDLDILPLLRSTLQHPTLKERVLYGSDFYVVRNHKSDKNMLADIRGGLLKPEFDQIACINPLAYLKRQTTPEPPVDPHESG